MAGMHRSGTSLTASLLADAGLYIGDQLMGAYPGNVRGHFEDLEFCALHERILAAGGLSSEGYTCLDAIIDVPTKARAEAAALVARRRAADRPWGWKDPRSTLFLDLWRELLPEARFLFIVRSPWEVVDSLFRRGDEPFVVNPRFAVDLWLAYNRRIRDFFRCHPDRCMIVETTGVATNPAVLVAKVAGLLETPLVRPAALYDPQLLTHDTEGNHRGLVAALCPEAEELFDELRSLAGLPPVGIDAGPIQGDVLGAALAEWSAKTTVIRHAAERDSEHAAALARSEETIATLHFYDAQRVAELNAVRETCSRLEVELTACRGEIEGLRSTVATSQAMLAESRATTRTLQESLAESQATIGNLKALLDESRATARNLQESLSKSQGNVRDLQMSLDESQAAERAVRESLAESQATARALQASLVDVRAALADSEATRALAQTVPIPLTVVRPEDEFQVRNDAAALEAARAEVVALVDQLQAERECFEALRLDLVSRLETATAGMARGWSDRAGRGRKPLGQRIAAEYRRFVRRRSDRRRRSA
jgi:hypothetical protein